MYKLGSAWHQMQSEQLVLARVHRWLVSKCVGWCLLRSELFIIPSKCWFTPQFCVLPDSFWLLHIVASSISQGLKKKTICYNPACTFYACSLCSLASWEALLCTLIFCQCYSLLLPCSCCAAFWQQVHLKHWQAYIHYSIQVNGKGKLSLLSRTHVICLHWTHNVDEALSVVSWLWQQGSYHWCSWLFTAYCCCASRKVNSAASWLTCSKLFQCRALEKTVNCFSQKQVSAGSCTEGYPVVCVFEVP